MKLKLFLILVLVVAGGGAIFVSMGGADLGKANGGSIKGAPEGCHRPRMGGAAQALRATRRSR